MKEYKLYKKMTKHRVCKSIFNTQTLIMAKHTFRSNWQLITTTCTRKKVLLHWHLFVKVLKPFSFSLRLWHNKLVCLSIRDLSGQSNYCLPSGQLKVKNLNETNTLAYFGASSVTKKIILWQRHLGTRNISYSKV